MAFPHPLRVALLYDLQTWVLNTIAEQIRRHAQRPGVLEIQPMKAPRNRSQLQPLLANHDLIHFLSPGDFYRLGRATAAPTVVTVHHVASRLIERLNATGRFVDVLCPTNAECHARIAALPGLRDIPMIRVAMGIDTDVFQFRQQGREVLIQRSNAPKGTIFLGVSAKKNSNEDNRKGFDRYWALLAKLKHDFPSPVRLVLFGPGPEVAFGWGTEDIPEAVRDMVWLPGFLSLEELSVFYSGLDFYLCLSRIEGGPNPVLESMSCGVKVISTAVGIVPELVEEGKTGFLVDGDDYLERVPALLTELKEGRMDCRALSVHARDRILKGRAWPAVAGTDLYMNVYRQAWERYRTRPFADRFSRHARLFFARIEHARERARRKLKKAV